MLTQGNVEESPQDHVMVGVVPGVPDKQIMEQTALLTKDVVRTGHHLLAATEHAPRPDFSYPQKLGR